MGALENALLFPEDSLLTPLSATTHSTGEDIRSLGCAHEILPESIILYEEEMVGYCAHCGTRVAFPKDPFMVGTENALTVVIEQLVRGEDVTWSHVTDTISTLERVEGKAGHLREMLVLIEQIYGGYLDGELGDDVSGEAVVSEHGTQVASHDTVEERSPVEGDGE